MRTGVYAVVDGLTHRARFGEKKVHLIVPAQDPLPEGWEDRNRRGYWLNTVPRLSVSRLFYVRTTAVLDGLPVGVVNLHEAAGTAEVWAQAPYPGPEPVLHSGLKWVADNGSTLWAGTIAVDRLVDIDEPEYEIEVDSRNVPQPVWYPLRPS